ncbi:SMIM4 protein, partial [Sakesphorus luctuosus]|nr:SMIM4 protein [Sakesphorus luctuosus]
MLVSRRLKRLLQMMPGKRRFGVYRFLPFFFVLGGAMEWFMINVRIGKETFYDVYRRKRSERQYEASRMEKSE